MRFSRMGCNCAKSNIEKQFFNATIFEINLFFQLRTRSVMIGLLHNNTFIILLDSIRYYFSCFLVSFLLFWLGPYSI